MIIKGSSRGASPADVQELADHLLAAENETVEVLELRGVSSGDLPGALNEMQTLSLGSRCRRALYHASVNVDRREADAFTEGRWLQAVDALERRLGLTGHQRAVVQHVKRGRPHVHVVWCRVNPITLKAASDSQSYHIHESAARTLERRWNLRPVTGAHTRPAGTARSVARATHADWQAQTRTGVRVTDVADVLQRCWSASKDGRTFERAVRAAGLCLASGRRGIVVVDSAGTPHSLPRRLGLRAAEVKRKLADIDADSLPSVEDVKTAQPTVGRAKHRENNTMNSTRLPGVSPGKRRTRRPPADWREHLGYWGKLGFEPEETPSGLLVRLPGDVLLIDRGDTMSLSKSGEPTDEEIRLMVTAAKERWDSVRFYGGSPEFQRRARLEALRQGFPAEAISLECEDGRKPAPIAGSMPEHIRRKLMPSQDVLSMPVPPADVPPPAPEVRP